MPSPNAELGQISYPTTDHAHRAVGGQGLWDPAPYRETGSNHGHCFRYKHAQDYHGDWK